MLRLARLRHARPRGFRRGREEPADEEPLEVGAPGRAAASSRKTSIDPERRGGRRPRAAWSLGAPEVNIENRKFGIAQQVARGGHGAPLRSRLPALTLAAAPPHATNVLLNERFERVAFVYDDKPVVLLDDVLDLIGLVAGNHREAVALAPDPLILGEGHDNAAAAPLDPPALALEIEPLSGVRPAR